VTENLSPDTRFVKSSGAIRIFPLPYSFFESREQIAKTVTSLFTLLSVLGVVNFEFCHCHVRQIGGLQKRRESLQMMLMNRFCIFFQNKTVNYHMQASFGQAVLKFLSGLGTKMIGSCH